MRALVTYTLRVGNESPEAWVLKRAPLFGQFLAKNYGVVPPENCSDINAWYQKQVKMDLDGVSRVILQFQGKQLVGYCALIEHEKLSHTAYLTGIVVAEEFRNQGIATALLRYVCKFEYEVVVCHTHSPWVLRAFQKVFPAVSFCGKITPDAFDMEVGREIVAKATKWAEQMCPDMKSTQYEGIYLCPSDALPLMTHQGGRLVDDEYALVFLDIFLAQSTHNSPPGVRRLSLDRWCTGVGTLIGMR